MILLIFGVTDGSDYKLYEMELISEMNKKKIIVYGLGKAYENQKLFIEKEFEIIGYSDKNKKNIFHYISPEDIKTKEYDYIYVTSNKFLDEIKSYLTKMPGGGIEDAEIISLNDLLGDFQNEAVRRKWIINKLSNVPEGSILLDAGAGEMQYAQYCRKLKYIAQDFGEYDPKALNKGLKGKDTWDTSKINIKCDIIDIPLENASIDTILCSEVFEHLKNPLLALKEFSRILKPQGQLLLTAPFCSLVHMAPYYFSSGFSEFWYCENLKDYGFSIKEITPYGDYFKWIGQELFRINEMTKKFCDRQLSESEMDIITDGIRLMTKLSVEGKNSENVLCFGYMIEAIKE